MYRKIWIENNSDDRLAMVNLISLKASTPTKRNRLFFSKIELNIILSTYSNGVIKGFWKDYAIDQNGTFSTFSIYKNSQENPTFTLTKKRKGNGPVFNFILFYGSKVLENSTSLEKILNRLNSLPKVIKR